MLNKRKRRPSHPGALLREIVASEEAGLTQGEVATRLKVSRLTVSELINERRGVTPDMAHRLARLFETTPDLWLNMQRAVDVWDAWNANRATYNKIRPLSVNQRQGKKRMPQTIVP